MMRKGQIAAAFGASAVASLGLAIVYLTGGEPRLEGALLLVALGGIGWGLVAWAHDALPPGPEVELRGDLASTDAEREAFAADFQDVEETSGRRRLLTGLLGTAVGSLVVAAAFPIRSLGPGPGRALFETAWRPGRRLVNAEGAPVSIETLPVGGAITAFPEDALHQNDSILILVRVDPNRIELPSERRDWVPDGYMAYSKICPHAGCPVGLFDRQTGLLTCPCHQSAFLTLTGAVPVSGPAARPLPQLPLGVDAEGILVATGEFTSPIGPGFWELTRE